MNKRPDVLIIVADCARASDFSVIGSDAQSLPNLECLARSGTTFLRAVSPSNWTLPSHASMFTGLPPWEHGAVSDNSCLPADISTLAELALANGYRTASFSANPFVSDSTGLTRGFETAVWGRIEECSFRGCPGILRPRGRTNLPSGLSNFRKKDSRLRSLVLPKLLWGIQRFSPAIPDSLSRVLERTRVGGQVKHPHVSPWIEASVEQWVCTIPKEIPAFCFVNLLDAHEPYIGLTTNTSSLLDLRRTWTYHRAGLQIPQLGYDLPPKEVRSALYDIYQFAIRIIDERIGNLLSNFERYRDVDNLLVVVTGDHGQAFGEEGLMYHGFGTADCILRVPLIVKSIGSISKDKVIRDWVSTSQIAQLVRQAVLPATESSLQQIVTADPPSGGVQPVWSLGSRAPEEIIAASGKSRADLGDGRLIVGYWGEYKLVLDPVTGLPKVFEIGPGTDSSPASFDPKNREMAGVLQTARGINALLHATALDSRPEVSLRLHDWGYG